MLADISMTAEGDGNDKAKSMPFLLKWQVHKTINQSLNILPEEQPVSEHLEDKIRKEFGNYGIMED